MPRRARKKKAGVSQWPPLTFVSSPLFQPAPVVEVDMAASNPITAKAVPVDDLAETVWVSPQFSCLGRRVLRSTLSTYQRSSSTRSSTQLGVSSKRSKFRPLNFLEIANYENSPANPSNDNSPGRLINAPDINGSENSQASDATLHRLHNNDRLMDFTGKEVNIDKENLKDQKTYLCSPSAAPRRSERLVKHIHSPCPNNLLKSGIHETYNRSQANMHTSLGEESNSIGMIPDIVQKQSFNFASPTSTPTRARRKPCCRDVLKGIGTCEDADNRGDHTGPSQIQNDIESCQIATFQTHTTSRVSVPTSHAAHCYADDDTAHVFPHVQFSSTTSTPHKCRTGPQGVLAVDTPECDYGLRLRQRQLKYGLQDNNYKCSVKPP